MPENPIINEPDQEAPVPVVGDPSNMLRAGQAAGEYAAQRRRDRIVGGLREQLQGIYSGERINNPIAPRLEGITNISQPPLESDATAAETGSTDPLSYLDTMDIMAAQSTVQRFSNDIRRLEAAQTSGELRQSLIMQQAEAAVTRAQRAFPMLAQDFQREAMNVLGRNPIGYQLSLMESRRQAQAQAAQDQIQAVYDRGLELGMPIGWDLHNTMDVAAYLQLDKIDRQNTGTGSIVELLKRQRDLGDLNGAAALVAANFRPLWEADSADVRARFNQFLSLPREAQIDIMNNPAENQYGFNILQLRSDAEILLEQYGMDIMNAQLGASGRAELT
ncbi:MAG: hypothetical protein VW236_08320, partial [Flavobacteriaceae bacterium]